MRMCACNMSFTVVAPPVSAALGCDGDVAMPHGTDMDSQRAIFTFTVPLDYCHSGDVVQGGFVTAMLDAAMSHALFGTEETISGVASLDIATQFIGACRGQHPLKVAGWVKKATFKTAFLEADIQDKAGTLIATAQSVAKLSRQPAEA